MTDLSYLASLQREMRAERSPNPGRYHLTAEELAYEDRWRAAQLLRARDAEAICNACAMPDCEDAGTWKAFECRIAEDLRAAQDHEADRAQAYNTVLGIG